VERVARELQQPEELVDKIVSHQFKSAVEALKTERSVEISGFGKFLISPSKIKKRIAKTELMLQRIQDRIPTLEGATQESWLKKEQGVKQLLSFYEGRL
jgi:nucleoid DNA-binding protein